MHTHADSVTQRDGYGGFGAESIGTLIVQSRIMQIISLAGYMKGGGLNLE